MSYWGGAQWLVAFMVALRAIVGVLAVSGKIRVSSEPPAVVGKFLGQRVSDLICVAVLWWGGFW